MPCARETQTLSRVESPARSYAADHVGRLLAESRRQSHAQEDDWGRVHVRYAVVVDAERVTPLDLDMREVVRLAKNLGKGGAAALGDAPGKGASS